MEELGI